MRIKTDSNIQKIITELIAEGWTVSNKKNHIKVYDPSGRLRAVAGASPGDSRAVKNFRADIKKARLVYERSYKEKDRVNNDAN